MGRMQNSSDERQFFVADDPLAGMIRCRSCHGAMVRVNKRHYRCAQGCKNKLPISRKQIEEVLIKDLKEKFLGDDAEENDTIYVAHTSIQTLAFLKGVKLRKWRKR